MEEQFDIVDERDQVIGQAPRSEVHARKLFHRAVHVFVFNSNGELLLQMRTDTKDEYPSCYTSSASGHVSAGEDYDETAPRELEEELGISPALERLTKIAATTENAYEHAVLYQAFSEEELSPDPEEVAYVEQFSLEKIDSMVQQQPEKFTPPFLQLYQWYRQNQ